MKVYHYIRRDYYSNSIFHRNGIIDLASNLLCCVTVKVDMYYIFLCIQETKINEKPLGKSGEIVISLLEWYLGLGKCHTLLISGIPTWLYQPVLISKKPHVVNCQRKGIPITSEKLIGCEMCFRSSPNIVRSQMTRQTQSVYAVYLSLCGFYKYKKTKLVKERGYPNIVLRSKSYCQHGCGT